MGLKSEVVGNGTSVDVEIPPTRAGILFLVVLCLAFLAHLSRRLTGELIG